MSRYLRRASSLNPISPSARGQERSGPVVIWQLCDGKAGHLSQSTGLINALLDYSQAEERQVQAHQAQAPSAGVLLRAWWTRRPGWMEGRPAPRVAIGAGRATHLPLLALGRRGAKTVVLMRPSLPLSWFDFCLIPAHDAPPARDNVITTEGALNPMRPGQAQETTRGLILLGGPSRHYYFDADAVLSRLKEILAKTPQLHWSLSASPRTPPALSRALGALASSRLAVRPWAGPDPGWLAAALRRSAWVWVTEDSISMIYEALTAGCRVGLLPLRRKGSSRLHRAVDKLLREGRVRSFSDWSGGRELPAPDRSLDEAARCARLLLDKGLLAPSPCR